MPKFNETSDDKVINNKQETNSGIYVNSGEIQRSDFDTTDWSTLQGDYYEMRISDAVISKTWKMIIAKIATIGFRVEGKNKKVNEYVEWSLNSIEGGFTNLARHLLLAIPYGLSVGEKIVKNNVKYDDKSTNQLIKLAFFQNETINKFHYNESSIFTGVEHEKRIPDKGTKLIDIDKDKLHWFSFDYEYDDIRGNGIFRPLRFAWKLKQNVLFSTGLGIQRGAGIPIIEVQGNIGDGDKSKIEQIGRSIGNFKNGYVSYDATKMKVRLEELKNQKNNIQFIEFLNRELFFGMLSEFSTAGIGQNGSRAATSEHKSTFELSLNYIMHLLETNIQSLIEYIIEISLFGNIKEKDHPEFKFNSLTQIDLNEMAIVFRNLYDGMLIDKQPEDQEFFRETFGLPERKVVKPGKSDDNQPVNDTIPQVSKSLSNTKNIGVFELQSATDHYENVQTKASGVVDSVLEKALDDYANYYEKHGNAKLRERYEIEMISELEKVYEEAFSRGEGDVEKELSKISTKKLEVSVTVSNKKSKSITRFVKRLFFNANTVLEDSLEKVSEGKNIKEYIKGFSDGFKSDKRTIMSSVEDGYTDGRGQKLKDNIDEIESYLYTAVLDKNLCDNCAPFDSLELTLQEIKENELRIGNGRVNPDCLGNSGQWCRCQLVPYKIKEG